MNAIKEQNMGNNMDDFQKDFDVLAIAEKKSLENAFKQEK